MFAHIWKLLKWICGLPLFSLIIGIVTCLYNFCINIPSKVEEEHKKDKKEKEANAVWKSTSHLFKEIGDRLAEAEKRGVFDGHGEEPRKENPKKNSQ